MSGPKTLPFRLDENISEYKWREIVDILKNEKVTTQEIKHLIYSISRTNKINHVREFIEIYQTYYADQSMSETETLHLLIKSFLSDCVQRYIAPRQQDEYYEHIYLVFYDKYFNQACECIEYLLQYSIVTENIFDISSIFLINNSGTPEQLPHSLASDMLRAFINKDILPKFSSYGLILLKKLVAYTDKTNQKFPFSNLVFDTPIIEMYKFYDIDNVWEPPSLFCMRVLDYVIKKMILRGEKYDFSRFNKGTSTNLIIGFKSNYLKICNYIFLTNFILYRIKIRYIINKLIFI